MLQFIWKQFPKTRASFSFINRSVDVRLADWIDADEPREQLEQTKKLRFHKSELIWLAGNTVLWTARHLASLNLLCLAKIGSAFEINNIRRGRVTCHMSEIQPSQSFGEGQRCWDQGQFGRYFSTLLVQSVHALLIIIARGERVKPARAS
jgi:hypothetical protein